MDKLPKGLKSVNLALAPSSVDVTGPSEQAEIQLALEWLLPPPVKTSTSGLNFSLIVKLFSKLGLEFASLQPKLLELLFKASASSQCHSKSNSCKWKIHSS